MKVGVYVGSFNPPHLGHEQIINNLLKNKVVDKIIVIPTLSYWNKHINVSLKKRIDMLSTIKNDNVIINDTLNHYKNTYELMDKLSQTYDDLYLIIGADNIIDFDKWNNVDRILKHHVIVISRNDINIDEYLSKFDKSRFIIVDNVNFDISSTFVREKIKNREYHLLKGILNDKVIEYIKNNNLYR